MSGEALEKVNVTTDEGTLGDEPYSESSFSPQSCENGTSDLVLTLGWLVRICCGTDEDSLWAFASGAVSNTAEIMLERMKNCLARLDEDALLERLEIRWCGLCPAIPSPFQDVLVGVSSVTVRAPELTTDVWVDRPESHPGGFR
jgi:hypothetical protein